MVCLLKAVIKLFESVGYMWISLWVLRKTYSAIRLLDVIECTTWRIPDQVSTLTGLQLRLLVPGHGVLAHLLHLFEVETFELELGDVVYSLRIFWCDVVDLCQVSLRDEWVVDVTEQLGSVGMQVLACFVVHDTCVEVTSLSILADLAFVVVVALARNDVVGDFVRCLCHVWSEFVGEAIGCVLLVAGVVAIDPHCSIEVERRERSVHSSLKLADIKSFEAAYGPPLVIREIGLTPT